MTIPAAGVVKMSDLRTEYMPAGSNQNVLLSSFYRGNASGFVRKNAANNAAVNRSAAIPESGIIKLSQFRGQSTGWDYTNALPPGNARVRLACAVPILIGLKTLGLLRRGKILDPQQRIKISRAEVRSIVLQSVIRYPFPGWKRFLQKRTK